MPFLRSLWINYLSYICLGTSNGSSMKGFDKCREYASFLASFGNISWGIVCLSGLVPYPFFSILCSGMLLSSILQILRFLTQRWPPIRCIITYHRDNPSPMPIGQRWIEDLKASSHHRWPVMSWKLQAPLASFIMWLRMLQFMHFKAFTAERKGICTHPIIHFSL